MGEIFVSVLVFFLTLLWYISLKRNKKEAIKNGTKLPPGSLGWPYIGETLQLYSQDPESFFATKQKRYVLIYIYIYIYYIYFFYYLNFEISPFVELCFYYFLGMGRFSRRIYLDVLV